MAAVKSLNITIRGLLGMPDAEIEFKTGAVNVVSGKNGAGKTKLGLAMARALGDEHAEVEAEDGATLSSLEIAAANGQQTLVVSQAGRVRTKGAAPIALADMGAVSDLILGAENGAVRLDGKTAEKARQKAFVRIARPLVDSDAIAALCEGDQGLMEFLRERVSAGTIGDLLTAAQVVQDRLQTQARERETLADGHAGAHRAHLADANLQEMSLAGLGASLIADPDPKAAEARATVLAVAEANKKRTQGERKAMEARQAEIRAASTPRPDTDGAQRALYAKAGEVKALKTEAAAVDVEIAELAERLQGLRDRKADKVRLATERETEGRKLEEDFRNTRDAADRWDAQQALLLSTPEGATDAEVEAAEAATLAAQNDAEAHRISARVHELRRQAEEASAQSTAAATKAKELRETSKAVPERIADILARQGAAGFSMKDGALAFSVGDREPLPYSALSLGERTFAALELQTKAPGFGGWCWLEEWAFSALDFEHRGLLDAWAADHLDVLLATEQPSFGPLSVRYGAGGAA